MQKANADLRARFFLADLPQWRVAQRLGISQSTLSKKLRFELSETEKGQIIKVIDELAADAE